jgi:hypothetical protein
MSLAAAVSNIVYGARLGMLYSGAREGFSVTIDRPLRQVFDEWPSDRQPGILEGVSYDGAGVVYVLAATMAMRFFGLHAISLPLFTVALMACRLSRCCGDSTAISLALWYCISAL